MAPVNSANAERIYAQLPIAHLGKALAAIDGAVVLGKERNLRLHTTVGADCIVHFTRAAGVAVGLVCMAAFPAACGLVLEALLCVEFLFACGEREFLPAVTAYQSLVLIHVVTP